MLDKGVLLLATVEERPCTLAELVAATGISRATAHRLAASLLAHGLLRRDGEGRYALGLRLVALGRAAEAALPLGRLAEAALRELRDRTEESAQLWLADGDTRICVASLQSPHGLRTIVETGAVLSLDRGSAGSVLRSRPTELGEGWIASVAEREPGVASVSAPVIDGGRIVAAVGVSGPIERFTTQPGDRYGAAVTAAARAIEAAAGFSA